jgi:hypothetical protein
MGPLEAAYLQNVSPHQKRMKQEKQKYSLHT